MVEPRFSEAEPMEGDQQLPLDDYDVHPVADLFPMLDGDELAELAADIKARGQLQPIVLDSDGRVLDGRNRLAACRLAGVEPTFTKYDGDDPDGYALAVNIARRHLSTGARAMVKAKALRLIDGPRWKTADLRKNSDDGLSQDRLYEAATVLEWAPDLAEAVIIGAKPLSVAVAEARDNKRRADALAAKMTALREAAGDLHDLVQEGRMDVDEALAAMQSREAKARAEEAERRTAEEHARQQAREEERRAVERDRGRIVQVLEGWSSFNRHCREDTESDRAKAVMRALGEDHRRHVAAILEQIGA